MVDASSPPIPPYRVTLFFGPEVREGDTDVIYCVFNVKKRSWKGGIHCVVEMARAQISQCRHLLQMEPWLQHVLRHLPGDVCDDYTQRGRDICVQQLCLTKLWLAIGNGLRQDTTLLAHDVLAHELEHAIRQTDDAIKAAMLEELDVPRPEDETGHAVGAV